MGIDILPRKYLRLVAIVLLLAVMLIVASKINQWKKGVFPPQTLKRIRTLVKQSAHYASLAEQDTNPVYSLLHANTALNYFATVEALVSAKDLQRITGVNADEMQQYLLWQQEKALQQLNKTCPTGQPRDKMYPVSVSK
jgi:hypothetical protein